MRRAVVLLGVTPRTLRSVFAGTALRVLRRAAGVVVFTDPGFLADRVVVDLAADLAGRVVAAGFLEEVGFF